MATPMLSSGTRIPDAAAITGLVLAGGRGQRMGGVDKGLQLFDGEPLAQRALRRLAPQVGTLLISANRHRERYESFGARIVGDANADFDGPLAGILAGMLAAHTPYLACVPCDALFLPADLVPRLALAFAEPDIEIVRAAEERPESVPCPPSPPSSPASPLQPLFALLPCALADDLRRYLERGERRVLAWQARHSCREVIFSDSRAFYNANTFEALRSAHSTVFPH